MQLLTGEVEKMVSESGRELETRMAARACRTAIVVLGHGKIGADGVHRVSERCLTLVAEAERLADRIGPELVVFSGWSSMGGPPEAEQMRDAWRGLEVELLVEGTARSTAENASRTIPLLLERRVSSAVVVCSPPHLVRTRLLFRLYRERGSRSRSTLRACDRRCPPSPGSSERSRSCLSSSGLPGQSSIGG